jgi:hypothetical protein
MNIKTNRAKGADEPVLQGEESLFAEVENGVVQRVVVIDAKLLETGRWGSPENFVRTYTNAERGRKNSAGIGYTYREDLDAFVPPQPYESWSLNEETARWEAPVEMPQDGKPYEWNEEKGDWVEIISEIIRN